MLKYEHDFIYNILPNLTNAINNLSTAIKQPNDQNTESVSSANNVSSVSDTGLMAELLAFSRQAVILSDVIAATNSEELVSAGYPFDKSFDEMALSIVHWTNDVFTALSEEQEDQNE